MCARLSQVFLRAFSKRSRRSKSVLAVWLIRRESCYTASVPACESVPASAHACVCVCLHMSLQVSPACRRVLNFQGTQTFSQMTKKLSSAINLHFLTVPSTLRTDAGIGCGGRRGGGEGD